MNPLSDPEVRRALRKAWHDSNPGVFGGHEEGGFILRDVDGTLSVARWPKGDKANIQIPPHPGCRYNGKEIAATFHTHPNTGRTFFTEPSDEDLLEVQRDRNLKEDYYMGEFVLSSERIYLIPPAGDWFDHAAMTEALDVDDTN